jgi:AmmeMemoRadiSam system protein A
LSRSQPEKQVAPEGKKMSSETGAGVVIAGVSPHPPVIVPSVGGRDARTAERTARALSELSQAIVQENPDTLVLVGPHGPVFRDAIACTQDRTLRGDLSGFGAHDASVEFENDLELAREISSLARESPNRTRVAMVGADERTAYQLSQGLDHGAVVPLYFLKQAGLRSRLSNLTTGFLPLTEVYAFGATVARAAEKLGRRIAFLASGDLSHRLTPSAPAGYHPRGKEFDALIVRALREGAPDLLVQIDPTLEDAAGECGLRPIIMMFGSVDERVLEPQVLSYEGPFGVGYGVAIIRPRGWDTSRGFLSRWEALEGDRLAGLRSRQSPIVALARAALESYVRAGRTIEPGPEHDELLDQRAGAFVSLKQHGQLRGCIGTTQATTRNLAEEVIQNAISAGTQDPRFPPVEESELGELEYSVDVLGEAEPVDSLEDLDPTIYGVTVEKGYRRGLLLPDLEGIDTAEQQVEIARRKAGIRSGETGVKIFRFRVTRYH